MPLGSVRFGEFTFDPDERRLTRGAQRVDLSGRYLDALALLLRERGRLVTKDRFMHEVWRDAPVTDEALTQCIRALRRCLGDDAARPRFIETVPKHGYRFIADADEDVRPTASFDLALIIRTAGLGGFGGAVAGAGGGIFYGLVASAPSPMAGIGAVSALMVLLVISVLLGLAGGLGVAGGIAVAGLAPRRKGRWTAVGGLCGGFAVGGVAKLIGLDAFELLVGRSPAQMTGPVEGAVLGGALGLAAWIVLRRRLTAAMAAALGAVSGGAAGWLVTLTGGHLLGGSLNLLIRNFPDARFRLDAIGALLGEGGFGPLSEALTATIEGALFGLCVVGALALANSSPTGERRPGALASTPRSS